MWILQESAPLAGEIRKMGGAQRELGIPRPKKVRPRAAVPGAFPRAFC